ncbi:MAG: Rieske 2Fe-2S domain-containing protein [Desulfomonilaceae bacterium]|nr:Rieske 2Fe-2S domain-containing protein [Desulfomonilaceae bacterium]
MDTLRKESMAMSMIVDFFKAVAGICRTRPLDSDLWEVTDEKARVSVERVPELNDPGGAVYLAGKGLPGRVLIVARNDGGYVCAANRCTHASRRLDPIPGKETLRCCSVSHSTFDYEGNKLSGPARKPLKIYPWKLEGKELVIDVSG